jgi:glycosyltransferase involved in cell wall biosynthesis
VAIDGQSLFGLGTGVARYTRELIAQLPEAVPWANFKVAAFELPGRRRNFVPPPGVGYRPVRWIPARLYYRLMRHGLEPPLRLGSDLAIFPNFCVWRVADSRPVAVIHDLIFWRHPEFTEPSNDVFLRRCLRRTVARAWRVVVPSNYTSSDVIRLLGCDPERIRVAPSPIGEPFLARLRAGPVPPPATPPPPAAGGGQPYILFVGTLEPRKNVEGLLEAFGSLPPAQRRELRLVLAGAWGWRSGPIRLALDRAIKAGLLVTLTGRIDDEKLVDLYAGALLTVLPSHDEGFGLPVLEAMACGSPVLASSVGGLPEAAGGAAQLMATNDPRIIAGSMEALIGDPDERDRLRRLGWERARSFGSSAFTGPWTMLLEEAAAGLSEAR